MKTKQNIFYALAFVRTAIIDVAPSRDGILKTARKHLSRANCRQLIDYVPGIPRGKICIVKITRRFLEEVDRSEFNPCAPWPKPSIYVDGVFDHAPTVETFIEELAERVTALESRRGGHAFRLPDCG